VGRRSIFTNPNATGLATYLRIHADHKMARLPHPTRFLFQLVHELGIGGIRNS